MCAGATNKYHGLDAFTCIDTWAHGTTNENRNEKGNKFLGSTGWNIENFSLPNIERWYYECQINNNERFVL